MREVWTSLDWTRELSVNTRFFVLYWALVDHTMLRVRHLKNVTGASLLACKEAWKVLANFAYVTAYVNTLAGYMCPHLLLQQYDLVHTFQSILYVFFDKTDLYISSNSISIPHTTRNSSDTCSLPHAHLASPIRKSLSFGNDGSSFDFK